MGHVRGPAALLAFRFNSHRTRVEVQADLFFAGVEGVLFEAAPQLDNREREVLQVFAALCDRVHARSLAGGLDVQAH